MADVTNEKNEMSENELRIKKNSETELAWEQKRRDTVTRLKTDPSVQNYLNQFKPRWHSTFIDRYADYLIKTQRYAKDYEKIAEEQETAYMERADKALAEIQLKKLYDLRRQWGAELIKIEGVESSADFLVIGSNIMNSTLLTPVSRKELAVYSDYMQSPEYEYHRMELDWNDIDILITDGESEDYKYPAWFTYHDQYGDGNAGADLKDIRGEKEEWYKELGRKKTHEAAAEARANERKLEDLRPDIDSYTYDSIITFMRRFEDPETVRSFDIMCKYGEIGILGYNDEEDDENDYLTEQVDSIINSLGLMKDLKLPIKANSDHRLAIIDAWNEYEKGETLAALPAAYRNYQFRLKSKIAMPVYKTHSSNEAIINITRDRILRGREANGEPRDFNF